MLWASEGSTPIVRPFNCIGVGENRPLLDREIYSGNIKPARSHVVPDPVQKVLKHQNPLHILDDGTQVRCDTYGGGLARGIRPTIESPAAINADFNLSVASPTNVVDLATLIWTKIHGQEKPFRYFSDPPFRYDVSRRIPSVEKASHLLGFRAETTLDQALDEIIPWIADQIKLGAI
jgi:nucleoside-diphosphate-sugar epimerase